MDRVSVIDIGTNSILCLVASNRDGLNVEYQETRTARLGRDLEETLRIPENAVEKAVSILNEYKEASRKFGARSILTVGTQVFRSAENAEDALRCIAEKTGLHPRVLSEKEEAALGFYGAVWNRHSGTSLVTDIGGGSTEWVLGNGHVRDAGSIPLGAAVLTQKFIRSDPPSDGEWRDLTDHTRTAIRASLPDHSSARRLIAVGGTVTSLAAVDANLERYDPQRVDGSTLSSQTVAECIRRFRSIPRSEREAFLAFDPERADIILAGSAILLEIMIAGEFSEVLVSDRGLLHGLALQAFGYVP